MTETQPYDSADYLETDEALAEYLTAAFEEGDTALFRHALGVAARAFDYAKPDTMAAALEGVETLLLISSSEVGQRAVQHRNVIEAAKRAGVGRIVYTSILHADRSPISLAEEHRATEADLAASGIPATILRNGWYVENYTASIPPALANGAFVGSAGDGKLSLASRADYADAAVAVLTGQGHEGRTYELAGDDAVTLSDLAAELSKAAGRAIPYQNLPQDTYAGILKGAGIPDAFAEGLADQPGRGASRDRGGSGRVRHPRHDPAQRLVRRELH
ncbi:NAD(P)H-binding protein, partial [Methylobacterium sp. WL122]